jgi:hypothetical protein
VIGPHDLNMIYTTALDSYLGCCLDSKYRVSLVQVEIVVVPSSGFGEQFVECQYPPRIFSNVSSARALVRGAHGLPWTLRVARDS